MLIRHQPRGFQVQIGRQSERLADLHLRQDDLVRAGRENQIDLLLLHQGFDRLNIHGGHRIKLITYRGGHAGGIHIRQQRPVSPALQFFNQGYLGDTARQYQGFFHVSPPDLCCFAYSRSIRFFSASSSWVMGFSGSPFA